MSTFLTVLIIFTCVLLLLVILVQNPRGGGIASEFSSSAQFLGVRRTADVLEKATWTLATVLLALSLLSTLSKGTMTINQEPEIKEKILEMPEPVQNIPAIPQNIPLPKK